MTARKSLRFTITLALALVAITGCERKAGTLIPYPAPTDPVVFIDAFGSGVDFQAFLGSKLDAVSVDTAEQYSGSASLRVIVPAVGDPSGSYAGGAFTTRQVRDLTDNTALTFWVKASRAAILDVAGLGNDNTGTSRYEALRRNIPITTTWSKVVIPIPLPEKLAFEGGLFFFAEGPEGGQGCTIWFDEVKFENLPGITNPQPAMNTRTVNGFVGSTADIQGTRVRFDVDGATRTVECLPGYFDFTSSADTVATVTNGVIRIVGPGSAVITGKLGAVDATGAVTVNASAPPPSAAPNPVHPAADVISLFSNAYSNVPVDTWSATWDVADVSDIQIAGNDTKLYTNLVYAGVEFASPTVNATSMTYFHVDVWVQTGTVLRLKLVDFGADGVYGGGDDKEQELTFDASTTPAMNPGTWSSLDIPLADFTNLTTRGHLAQLILSGASTVFVDNVYFHK